jgi:catechol 2,3-dioxygenase-like lactoylglutathione lyase family enzyme
MQEEPSTRGRFLGLDHVTIAVQDLAVAERFYSDILGAELLGGTSRQLTYWFGGGVRVQLCLQRRREATTDHPRYGFAVAPWDLLLFKETLEAHGIAVTGPAPGGPPGHTTLHFLDPFGNHLELTAMGYIHDLAAPHAAALQPRIK